MQSKLADLPKQALHSFRAKLADKLMNDNFYSFSFNKTLLSMPVKDLHTVPGLRATYIQLNSMNKCIPQDWFLGYD